MGVSFADIWLASWLEVDRHEIRTRLGDRCRRDPLQLAGHSQTWPASLRSKKWLRVEDARPTADAEPGPCLADEFLQCPRKHGPSASYNGGNLKATLVLRFATIWGQTGQDQVERGAYPQSCTVPH